MFIQAPRILKNINNKYYMVSKNHFLYRTDYINGHYDRVKNIFDIINDLEQNDLDELEIFLAYLDN